MASYLNSDSLIASIKLKAAIPISQVTFEDTDILQIANEEMAIGLVPTVLQFHEEYLVYEKDLPLVVNQLYYDIPSRAIGNKLRTFFYKDTNSNLQDMFRILPDELPFHKTNNANEKFNKYYLENGSIVLINAPKAAIGSFYMTYYLRPNELVTTDRVSTITAIDRTAGVITVDALPIANGTGLFSPSKKLDFLETGGTHRTRAFDITPLQINDIPKTITVNVSDIPDSLMVGDYIALSGECIIPQLPDELHTVLAQRAAARILESLGDETGFKNAMMKVSEMEQKMGMLIDNRVENAPSKVNNIRGLLRSAKIRTRYNF